MLALIVLAGPVRAADINVLDGTLVVDNISVIGSNNVIVDNSADQAATLQIDSGVTVGNLLTFNNGGALINAGSIVRTGIGIEGVYGNTGPATVTNHSGGTITVDDIGVFLKGGGSLTNAGDGTGINARIGADIWGTSTVTNELGAKINVTGAGLYLTNSTVINRSGATIDSDAAQGIIMWGTGSVLNTGIGSSISGFTDGVAIVGNGADVKNLDGASISGGDHGVWFGAGGSITNGEGSTITGGTGVEGVGAVELDNAGTIEGTAGDGIALGAGSSITNHGGGTISGTAYGADTYGEVTNTDTGSSISGDYIAVRLSGGGTVTNTNGAAISGGLGIEMYDGGDVVNKGGATITGTSGDGIDVWTYGSVINSGAGSRIEAAGFAGVYFAPYGIDGVVFSLTNEDGAEIIGDSYGADIDGAEGTVLNAGGAKITSVNGSAVQMNGGGSVTNESGGKLQGLVDGLYLIGGDYTVLNSGAGSSISGGLEGIFVKDAATITNADGASLSGDRFGAWMEGGGSFTNTGSGTTITANGDGVFSNVDTTIINEKGASITSKNRFAVELQDGGTVTNSGAGSALSGGAGGVQLVSGGSVVNENSASISSANIGALLLDGGSITNRSGATISGTFRGVQAWGADISNTGAGSSISSDDTAVQTWDGGGSVTNADGAVMHGKVNGVLLDISSPLVNSGSAKIIGDSDSGVLSYDGGIVTNTGSGSTISGGTAGIQLIGGPGTIINTEGAEISGGYGAIGLFAGGSITNGANSSIKGDAFGVYVEGGAATLSNAGSIVGAVQFDDAYANAVTLYTGSSIDGDLYINTRHASTLTLDGVGSELYSEAITGITTFDGVLTKQGSGTWAIDEDLTATSTEVVAGTLVVGVNGSGSLTGAVTVDANGTLGGSGSIVGNVTVNGTVAPGNSPGTLSIHGNYQQASGAIYQAQLDPANVASDRIDVSGSAAIDNAAVLDVSRTSAAPYVVGTRYTVLSTTNGRTGSFVLAGDTGSAFLRLIDDYDAYNAYLDVVQFRALTDVTGTANETVIARRVQSLAPDNSLFAAVVNLPDDAAARDAFDQLSGEIHASIKGVLLDDSRFVRDAAFSRLADTFCDKGDRVYADRSGARSLGTASDCVSSPGRAIIWGRAFGSWGDVAGDGDAAGLSRTIGGFISGIDAAIDGGRFGVLAGQSRSNFGVSGRRSSASSTDDSVGLYGGKQWGRLSAAFGTAYTWHDIETTRDISISDFVSSPRANYDASTTQAFGRLDYRLLSGVLDLVPFADLAYVDQQVNGFSEYNGPAALSIKGSGEDVTFSTLGVRVATGADLDGMRLTATATLGWRHAFGDTTPDSALHFSGGETFNVTGVPIARDAGVAEAGLELHLTENISLGISYAGQFANRSTDQSANATLGVQF
jgi:outer membrane autotransporter protein